MAKRLTDADRTNLGTTVPGWAPALDRDALRRDFKFADFSEAWGFMTRVALLAEKMDYDLALTYENKSIENEDRYDNEITKSKILFALNRKDDGLAAQKRALDMATPLQIHFFARGLQGEKRYDEAFVIFRENAQKHPDLWFTHTGMARIYSSQSKFDDAAKEMRLALAAAPENQKVYVAGLVKKLESKQDIN